MRFIREYNFLSNFYPAEVKYDGHVFLHSENAYQYAKIRVNPDIFKKVGPGEAKGLGKLNEPIEGWEEKKVQAMREILNSKFSPGSELANKLIAVQEEIVEHNYWHDKFWGVCTCKGCDNKGQNTLGKLLMEIRDNLIK